MPEPIQSLLFDVEGVIAFPDLLAADRRFRTLRSDLDSASVHEARNRPAMYSLWERYSKGQVTRYSYWRAVVEELELPGDPEHVIEILDIQSTTCWRRIDMAMLELVRALRQADTVRLGLLSNSAPDHESFIAGFEEDFHIAHFSHRTGRRKPEPEAYFRAVDALGTAAEHTLFIDDKERNIEAADKLGLATWHYQDFDSLVEHLREPGLLDG